MRAEPQPLRANSVGILQHPCDVDLIVFFHRHPHALLTSERIAAYVGYDLGQVGQSIDRLTEAGLLERSQNPTHAARLYVLKPPEGKWLAELTSTGEGRRQLISALSETARPEETDGNLSVTRLVARPAAR